MNTNIIALVHNTSMENISSILTNGLYTDFERFEKDMSVVGFTSGNVSRDYSGQYPGVYLSPLTDRMIPIQGEDDVPINYEWAPIYLVFSIALLNRRDYHINVRDSNGLIYDGSYDASYLDNNFLELTNYLELPEVIFHNKVDMRCLQEIWVRTERDRKQVQRIIPKHFKDIVFVQTTVPNTVYDMECSYDDAEPNYCHLPGDWILENDDYRRMDISEYKKIAKNCGYNGKYENLEKLLDYAKNNDIVFQHLKSPQRRDRSPYVPCGDRGMSPNRCD